MERYARNNSMQKFTLIENLPDLEDFDQNPNNTGLTQTQYNQVQNKVRGPSHGIDQYKNQENMSMIMSKDNVRTQNKQPNYIQKESFMHGRPDNHVNHVKQVEEHFKTFNMPPGTPTCLDVAEHIANCPICSKFYNTDKTIYIIAIIALAIICILLLKKVLDV